MSASATPSQQDNTVALLFRALDFAARKHRDQRRKGAEASPISIIRSRWETY